MKTDFMLAITQLSAEKNLPKDVVLSAVETALVSAYKKGGLFSANQNLIVKINPANGDVRVFLRKTVVEEVVEPKNEMTLVEAQQSNTSAAIGETIEIEATPTNAGRIAAQTARQVIVQRLHEAEHNAVFEEYSGKEGDVITGSVQRIEPRQVFIGVGHAEAVLPLSEQAKNERYRMGQRLRVYVVEVARTSRGPQVIVSRAHRNLLRRLFELEIPEIFNGAVEIKSVAREAGQRSKVAAAARQEGIDPVGCCVGLRGIRIQSIVNELNGEKIDVVQWDPDPAKFISNALSPAQITSVALSEAEHTATVVVPDKQLSLAIGKEGQNARLAAKLTGWRIDIKSATAAEAKRAAVIEAEKIVGATVAATVAATGAAESTVATPEAKPGAEAKPAVAGPVQPVAPIEPVAVVAPVAEPVIPEVEVEEAPVPEEEAPEEVKIYTPDMFKPPPRFQGSAEPGQIRFAEDVLGFRGPRGGKKGRNHKEDSRAKKAKRSKGPTTGGTPAPEAG